MSRAAELVACIAVGLGSLAVDLDGDGIEEKVEETFDRGSGWSSHTRCIVQGATGERACRTSERTVYGWFEGVRARGGPVSLLGALDCVAADRSSPSQAAMWRLATPSPLSGTVTLEGLAWHEGPPQAQVATCLSLEQARTLHGGITWDASGTVAPEPGEEIVVRYAPRWWSASGGPPRPDPALREILVVGTVRFLVAGQALAVHDTARDRHAWVVNYAGGGSDGFKVDRSPRILAVATQDGDVVVELATMSAPGRLVVDL